jgi:hypothetical protein
MKAELGIPKSIREAGVQEADFLAHVDKLSEDAFDDQCTGANPRYPLISELKQILLDTFYGREFAKKAAKKEARRKAEKKRKIRLIHSRKAVQAPSSDGAFFSVVQQPTSPQTAETYNQAKAKKGAVKAPETIGGY